MTSIINFFWCISVYSSEKILREYIWTVSNKDLPSTPAACVREKTGEKKLLACRVRATHSLHTQTRAGTVRRVAVLVLGLCPAIACARAWYSYMQIWTPLRAVGVRLIPAGAVDSFSYHVFGSGTKWIRLVSTQVLGLGWSHLGFG